MYVPIIKERKPLSEPHIPMACKQIVDRPSIFGVIVLHGNESEAPLVEIEAAQNFQFAALGIYAQKLNDPGCVLRRQKLLKSNSLDWIPCRI
jgi:hypothetical protein